MNARSVVKQPKLRDSRKLKMQELYPINQFPDEIINMNKTLEQIDYSDDWVEIIR